MTPTGSGHADHHPLLTAVRPVVEAVGGVIVPADARQASDVPLVWEDVVVGAARVPTLLGALERLFRSVEVELGGRLAELSREDKQRALRLLDERGAFMARRAVELVAKAMSVSRGTIYTYIHAINRSSSTHG
jgi:hypothetical protein